MQHYLNLLSLALPWPSRNHLLRQTPGPSDKNVVEMVRWMKLSHDWPVNNGSLTSGYKAEFDLVTFRSGHMQVVESGQMWS